MSSQHPSPPSLAQASRRSILCFPLAVAGFAWGATAAADRWPSRPIVLTLTGPAGSGPDTIARDLVARIGMSLGKPIVVENVPGAGGIIAMERVSRAPSDGYHFIFTHIGAVAMNPALFKVLPYDPVLDFDPVSLVQTAPMILVTAPSLEVRSLEQLLTFGRRNPAILMYGSAGIGTPPHVFVEQLKAATNLPMGHVPFKGSPGLVQALIGGHIQVGMEGPGVLLPLIHSGKVRPLAISGDVRMDMLPDVPTFEELGIPGIGVSWLAVLAPKGTLPEAVETLNRELTRVLALPDLRQEWGTLGRQVGGGSPEILAERIRTELPRWRGIIESAGIRPE